MNVCTSTVKAYTKLSSSIPQAIQSKAPVGAHRQSLVSILASILATVSKSKCFMYLIDFCDAVVAFSFHSSFFSIFDLNQ